MRHPKDSGEREFRFSFLSKKWIGAGALSSGSLHDVCRFQAFCYFCIQNRHTLNYLAHIYLSGTDSQMKIGNFIGDFVKGSQLDAHLPRIRKGIALHRHIDSFTDSHPLVRETVVLLRPAFGRYSAIIADMYFDYFLAASFPDYSGKRLNAFAFRFYLDLLLYYRHLPPRVKHFVFHFISTNRLYQYSTLDGLKSSLEIMSNHKVPAINPDKTIDFLIENHDELEKRFHQFFPDLVQFVKKEII